MARNVSEFLSQIGGSGARNAYFLAERVRFELTSPVKGLRFSVRETRTLTHTADT